MELESTYRGQINDQIFHEESPLARALLLKVFKTLNGVDQDWHTLTVVRAVLFDRGTDDLQRDTKNSVQNAHEGLLD
jgi:hypothetical protein